MGSFFDFFFLIRGMHTSRMKKGFFIISIHILFPFFSKKKKIIT